MCLFATTGSKRGDRMGMMRGMGCLAAGGVGEGLVEAVVSLRGGRGAFCLGLTERRGSVRARGWSSPDESLPGETCDFLKQLSGKLSRGSQVFSEDG